MSTEAQSLYLWDLYRIYPDAAKRLGYDPDEYNSSEAILQNMKGRIASELIDKICKHATSVWPWKPTSKQSVVAELQYQHALAQGRKYVSKHGYEALLAWTENKFGQLQSEFRPLIFTRNPTESEKQRGITNRIPVDLQTARAQFIKQAGAVRGQVNQRLVNRREEERQDQQEEEQQEEQEQEIGEQLIEEEKKEEKHEDQIPQKAEAFWTRYVQIRSYAEQHNIGGHQIDTIERRPYEAAVGMIVEDVPTEAIVWAMCMDWPESNRHDLGITEYDVRTFKPERRVDGLPPEFPYLEALYRQRINPWLISAAGIGKTTTVRLFANHFDMPWCAIPMNRGTSPGAFNGRQKITNTSIMVRLLKALYDQDEEEMIRLAKKAKEEGDVTVSEFQKICVSGGHVLLDEIDAGDENLLMMVNMPLANRKFANTTTGETIDIHPDTMFWAASNTMGRGVTAGQGREYRGRNALDFATIDRFRMGRVVMKGDIIQYRKHFEELILARMT